VLGAARKCPRVAWTLALALVVELAAPLTARPVRAEPALDPGETQARLEAIYSAANQATAAGDHVAAAERYAEVLTVLPESRDNHESRALALLDSVAARRRAHAYHSPGPQLCAARDLVRGYLDAARGAYGPGAADMDGVRQAEPLRDELVREIAGLPDPTCPGDQPAPAPAVEGPREPLRLAPAPAPAPDRRVAIGAALLGAGGLGLVLMATGLGVGARAEARGREARADDPTRDIDDLLADGFIRRGRAGNRLAVAGGVLGGVLVIAGATLLALAKTRPRVAHVARIARIMRHGRVVARPGGLALRF